MNKTVIPIVDQIDELVKDIPGWCPVDQLYTLFNIAYLTANLEGDIVEIGSWCGRSSCVLGLAARLIGNTKVYCIDLFPEKNDWNQNPDGSYSLKVKLGDEVFEGYQEQTVWQEPFERDIAPIYEKHESVFEVFSEVIERSKMQNVIEVYRGNSTSFINSVSQNFKCKLVFLDGDHSYDAVCLDIRNVGKCLVEGGWICFDDAFSCYDSVNLAITDLIIKSPVYELCQQMTRKLFVARKRSGRG